MMTAVERPKANILIAYPYMKPDVIAELARMGDSVRLLVDSGAFTAWKAGQTIHIDEYCDFIAGLPIKPWRYFTLDVVGDPKATRRNYDIMRERGLTPAPIFTRGDDPQSLEDYYQTSDLVGIGGLVGTRGNKGFVNGIMRRIGQRKVHWLGFTSLDYIKHYRPYMCDSSSWESGARYGRINLYMGHGRFEDLTHENFSKCRDEAIFARIRHYGRDPSALLKRDSWHGGATPNRYLSAASGLALSIDIGQKLGTLMFNAMTTNMAVRLFADAYAQRFEGQPA